MDELDALAFDHAPMSIALTEHRIIRTCNRGFADMFGYSKADLIGRFEDLVQVPRKNTDAAGTADKNGSVLCAH
ncbi:MAG: PAS domain-containing protein [Pseudomonadota bacterium]